MSRTSLTRWTLATLGFLAIGWIELATGRHGCALATLVAVLVLIAVFGGSRQRDRAAHPPPEEPPEP